MRFWVFGVLAFVLGPAIGNATCFHPAVFSSSTVGIVRHFSEEERADQPGVVAARGTAWFLSPRAIVTASHVAEGMRLSEQGWKNIKVRSSSMEVSAPARIIGHAGSGPETVTLLELGSLIPGALPLKVRNFALSGDEPVASVGYPGGVLRMGEGRFVRYGTAEERLVGTALFEIADGNDRLVIDRGASGAPILDCDGRVVAVVTNVLTQSVTLNARTVRVSTAWRSPNVVAVPVGVLDSGPGLTGPAFTMRPYLGE